MAAMHPSRSEFISVRTLRYHIRHWGSPGAPMLFMLHGWMDVSASFQFVVDALQRSWHVVAPDWRGFGLSDPLPGATSWFPDYLADLDAILEHYSPGRQAVLVGHSMGGNIAMVYAGVRPQRVSRLINLEGVGLACTEPGEAPRRYANWLDELRDPPGLSTYAGKSDVAKRLQMNNPRLERSRAEFLAGHWAQEGRNGRWEILADPAHKRVNPVLYRVDEITACWQQIQAPVLWVEAQESISMRWPGTPPDIRKEVERRIRHIPNATVAVIEGAGHMVHHDQPEKIAGLIERFIG